MAKRLHRQYRVIDSAPVQGDGSFVKVKNMTLSELMDYGKANGKKSDLDPSQMGLAILDQMIVDWNWVDDDDRPLPIPAENPGTIAALPFQEANWLLESTGLQEMFDQKN